MGKATEYFYSHVHYSFFNNNQYYKAGHTNYIYVLCCSYERQNTGLYTSYSFFIKDKISRRMLSSGMSPL
jgi:hypothetical protein